MVKKVALLLIFIIGLAMLVTPVDKLSRYKKKRDLTQSTEPSEDTPHKTTGNKPIFVVQKHDASHLHYDFRLEINGVLKSWAIPKGPSTDPKDRRLAIETEDHPMAYANFEGVIPEGNYGAGTVEIWDKGHFDNIKEKDGKPVPLEKCYKDGTIEVNLHGKKLHGGYALIRTKSDDMKKWLCIKMRDDITAKKKRQT